MRAYWKYDVDVGLFAHNLLLDINGRDLEGSWTVDEGNSSSVNDEYMMALTFLYLLMIRVKMSGTLTTTILSPLKPMMKIPF